MHLIVTGNLERHFVGENVYVEYLRHLQKNLPLLEPDEQLALSYNDYLQSPLQVEPISSLEPRKEDKMKK